MSSVSVGSSAAEKREAWSVSAAPSAEEKREACTISPAQAEFTTEVDDPMANKLRDAANIDAVKEVVACPGCSDSMEWSDYAGFSYERGWSCNNVHECGHHAKKFWKMALVLQEML